jgi:hypothetical protein
VVLHEGEWKIKFDGTLEIRKQGFGHGGGAPSPYSPVVKGEDMDTKLVFLLMPMLAACSSTGSSVGLMKVAASEYENWSCNQLADEQRRLSIAMKVANVPDRQGDYAAVTQAMDGKKCGGPKPIVAGMAS